MSWKGDPTNLPPNSEQSPINRSEKMIADNRAEQVRRDTDSQSNFKITLYDIDNTILLQLEQLQLQITDVGKKVKVPIFYGSPERWVSAQRDGYIRDKQGKLILPAIIFKRTNSEADTSLQFFNRYINTPVIQLYSPKNKYTKFNVLVDDESPVHEVYNLVVPKHMVLTYHFIVWTEGVEQMNEIVETIQFNTKDYWGSKNGFRFRTQVEGYSHTVEMEANEDRIVKTEFELLTHGYILPDMITKLDAHKMTTQKSFTPKKIIMGSEIMRSKYSEREVEEIQSKWKNQMFPNLQKNIQISMPPTTFGPDVLPTIRRYGLVELNTTASNG